MRGMYTKTEKSRRKVLYTKKKILRSLVLIEPARVLCKEKQMLELLSKEMNEMCKFYPRTLQD